jgi:hypothetical protein
MRRCSLANAFAQMSLPWSVRFRGLLGRTRRHLRVCVCCGGRLIVRALVTDPATVGKMLAALRRPHAPPAAA